MRNIRGGEMLNSGSEKKLRNKFAWFLVNVALKTATPAFRQLFEGLMMYGQNSANRDTLQHRPMPEDFQNEEANERYRCGED